jgi:hypothetical protein
LVEEGEFDLGKVAKEAINNLNSDKMLKNQ